MTRASSPHETLEHRSFGSVGATRTVVVLRHTGVSTDDPLPAETLRRDVRILAIGLSAGDLDDPAAYRGQSPAETSTAAVMGLIDQLAPGDPVGLVGVGPVVGVAVRVAAAHADRIDRLALVAAPAPETAAERDLETDVLAGIAVKTLIVNGQSDPDAGASAASFYREAIPGARVEMVPGAGGTDARLPLADVWGRVLSHCAPHTLRAG